MADGKIVFKTTIDNSSIQKELDDAKKKIDAANKDIEKKEAAKLPLVDESEKLVTVLDEAKEKLHELQKEKEKVDAALNSPDIATYLDAYDRKDTVVEAVKQQEKTVADLQKQWDKVEDKIDSYNQKINQSKQIVEEQTARAGELSAQLTEGAADMSTATQEAAQKTTEASKKIVDCGNEVTRATTKAAKKTSDLGKRLFNLARSALVFSVITAGLTAMRNYMGKALKTNDQFAAQLAKLKAAMLTAFQPIYEFVVPALITLMQILTVVFQWLARLLSLLGGKTAKQSADAAKAIYEEANAIDAVGSAAKKAQKSLAGFDEINTLGGNDTGGAGSNSSAASPDFSDFSLDDSISDDLNNILGLVTSIGAALLTWSVAKTFVPDLQTAAGAALSVGGALLYAFNWGDALVNGVDWTNLQGMMLGITAAGVGLFIVFGSVGAAVAALIGGVGLIILGLKEFIETGTVTDETLVALEAGILLVGIAVSALTGSWIPALIAAVAGLALFIVTRGDEIKSVLNGIDEWLQDVFAKDWTEVFGPVLGGALNWFFDLVKSVWDGAKKILEGIIDFVTGVFSGDWEKAWNGIVSIFGGIFEGLVGILKGVRNGIAAILNGIISAVVSVFNFILRAINEISVTVPEWDIFGDLAGKRLGFNFDLITPYQIPYLAKGAVLPANKPFMAVVGDQKHGTNIEAPLETIQEAVAIVMEDMIQSNIAGHEATVAVLQQILEAVLGIEIDGEIISKAVDIITVKDRNGKTFTTCVMTRTQRGQRDTLECTGSPRRDSSTAANNESFKALNAKMLEVRKSIDGLNIKATKLNSKIDGAVEELTEQIAEIDIKADGISASVTDLDKKVNQNAEQAHSQIAQVDIKANGISASVQDVQRQVNTAAGKAEQNAEELSQMKESVAEIQASAQGVSVKVQSIIDNGVSKVTTGMGYTFDDEGLKIKKPGGAIENKLDDEGMEVSRSGETMLRADKDGVLATDVTVRNYLVVGNHARFENYSNGTDSKRTACFWTE